MGTKIYNWDGRAWQEDAGWVRSLDAGWRVEVVREAAYAALAKVGRCQLVVDGGSCCGHMFGAGGQGGQPTQLWQRWVGNVVGTRKQVCRWEGDTGVQVLFGL